MKKNKKHFLEENSYTRYNVDAILDTTSTKNSKKALIWGSQLYYVQRQSFFDVVFLQAYLDIYHRFTLFFDRLILSIIQFTRHEKFTLSYKKIFYFGGKIEEKKIEISIIV